MKPPLLTFSGEPGYSFSVSRGFLPNHPNRWHCHAELELIYFKKSHGSQFIGEHIKRFKPGDLVLVGAYLPHYWKFDLSRGDSEEPPAANVQILHFREDFLGEPFLALPENLRIKQLMGRAQRGLLVKGRVRRTVVALLERLSLTDGMHRIQMLLEILYQLAGSQDLVSLSNSLLTRSLPGLDEERLSKISEHSRKHFGRTIPLQEIAAVANLSPHSFCRFFKSHTGRTYSRFLIELRVGQACKLLIEKDLPLKQVCFGTGFNNFTSFYKYFKLVIGKSPLTYRRTFANVAFGQELPEAKIKKHRA